ncbi:MAG: putative ABC transport system permease protein [Flammeovirgaceae bacterium]|jgi:putative ABC transport system permease protein
MLKNYIKLALKVMRRKKFFSFVSLFGISFTLMVMMVLISLYDHAISPNKVDDKRDRNLYVIKTNMTDSAKTNSSNNPVGFYLLKNHIKKLKTPERITLFKMQETYNAFTGSQKLDLSTRYTDSEYWDVFSFNFIEGKGYNKTELESHDYVTVISESSKNNYFGKGVEAVGKMIEANNIKYRVVGVVEDVSFMNIHASGDMYLPYTVSPENFEEEKSLRGIFFGVMQAKDKSDFKEIKAEFAQMINNLDIQSYHKGYDIFNLFPDNYLGVYTREIFDNKDSEDDKAHIFYMIFGGFMLLFMLLPAINLVNLNITRIMERASEIGVRKAFGASDGALVKQFLVENIIITFIGGLLGIIMTVGVLAMLNFSQFIPHAHLTINLKIFLIGLGITFAFGILSGVYPAFRMSKMRAATVLRGNGK